MQLTIPDPRGKNLVTMSQSFPHLGPRYGRWGIPLIGALLTGLLILLVLRTGALYQARSSAVLDGLAS